MVSEDIRIADCRNEACDARRSKWNKPLVSIPTALLDLPNGGVADAVHRKESRVGSAD
jgi:hypothetical protein